MSHLYVMQNQFGLVKIGQSYEPQKRCRELQKTDECSIVIVAILEGRGHEEEEIHWSLRQHRITGEWFEGDERALNVIKRQMKLPKATVWPFAFQPTAAAQWVIHVEALRDQNRRVRDFNRVMRRLKHAEEASVYLDAEIWDLLHPSWEIGVGFMPGPEGRTLAVLGLDCDDDNHWQYDELVPSYTREVEAALLTWPEQTRPVRWEGTAVECCVAGLTAERKTWGKTPEVVSGRPRFHGPAWNRPPPDARNRLLSNLRFMSPSES